MAPALLLLLQTEITQIFATTGIVARVVLLILLLFSIFSWAIIFNKQRNFKKARRASQEFLRVFRQSRKLSEVRDACLHLKDSPLAEVFLSGYRELENQVTYTENPGKPQVRSVESIHRALQIASSAELTRYERWMSFLATCGGVTPFIGLFGTVWGIMDAFYGLANANTASFHSVAPGIAEALITTAAGLFAAIPAVVAYNYFLQRIKELGALMDDFALEFLNLTERNFT